MPRSTVDGDISPEKESVRAVTNTQLVTSWQPLDGFPSDGSGRITPDPAEQSRTPFPRSRRLPLQAMTSILRSARLLLHVAAREPISLHDVAGKWRVDGVTLSRMETEWLAAC